ncbi:cation transporter [Clostridium hydrogeniformans]|uniref:cation transporter n=1 Tax=Clostridium hydrogeniformans TaxID=349933 RepID=UPI00048337F0|nr:cation transporter [Clostridium hydrogeniformans]
MKKKFRLEGLDCANCAAKIENAINKLPVVNEATVDFMTTKLILEADDDKMEEAINASKEVIKKMEPGVNVKKI